MVLRHAATRFLSIWALACLVLVHTPALAREMVSIKGNVVNMRSGPSTGARILWELERGYPLDVLALKRYLTEHKTLLGAPGTTTISNDDFWAVPCEYLVPAALESQINRHNADRINARIVAEGANGPTTPEADTILADRGITVVPDVLANAGGVTVSYFEWVQDFSSFFWTEDEIYGRLERIKSEAFNAIWQMATDRKMPLRSAAFVIGCSRVLEARATRGLYP